MNNQCECHTHISAALNLFLVVFFYDLFLEFLFNLMTDDAARSHSKLHFQRKTEILPYGVCSSLWLTAVYFIVSDRILATFVV